MGEVKLVLVGVGGVGKSALTISYVSNTWVPEYDPTIEDSHRKQVSVDDSVVMLDILDTAGQEEYSSMQDQWFRTGSGFYVVYSIISKKSFLELNELRNKILRIKNKKTVPIVLIGNKQDLESEREVTTDEGQKLAQEWGCPFMESSAKNHYNVEESFSELVREVRRFQARSQAAQNGANGAASPQKPVKKSFCLLL